MPSQDEASVAGHLGERAPKAVDGDSTISDSTAVAAEAPDEAPAAAGIEAASEPSPAASANLGSGGGSLERGGSQIGSAGGELGESSSAYEAFLEGAADPYATRG